MYTIIVTLVLLLIAPFSVHALPTAISQDSTTQPSELAFKTTEPVVQLFGRDLTQLDLFFNSAFFDEAGRSRIFFDRPGNKLYYEGIHKPWSNLELGEDGQTDIDEIADAVATQTKNAFTLLPNSNTGFNAWFSVIQDSQVFTYSTDDWNVHRDMFMILHSGEVLIESVNFINAKGEKGVFRRNGENLLADIKLGLYGQRLVKEGRINVNDVAYQFDDLRHLLRFPLFQIGSDQFHIGMSDGLGELYRNRSLLQRAVSGEPVTLSLEGIVEKGITLRQIRETHELWGYRESSGHVLLNPGEFTIDEAKRTIALRFIPGTHPHNFFGITTDGEFFMGAVGGLTHFEGISMHALAQFLIEQSAHDVFLWGNGKDAVLASHSSSVHAKGSRSHYVSAIVGFEASEQLTDRILRSA